MKTARLTIPFAVLALGLACDSLQPSQVDEFGDDTWVPDDDETEVPTVDDSDVPDDDDNEPTDGNTPPNADAGPARIEAAQGEVVFLDGTGSSDADGDPLTYQWVLQYRPGGSAASIDNPTFATAQVQVDRPGQYEVHLTVNDGDVSDKDILQIAVAEPDAPPVADAGQNQSTLQGSLVQLTGAGSYDPNSDDLTYHWEFVSVPGGSQAFLVGKDVQPATSPRFTADAVGQYVVQLIVNDGTQDSSPDLVYITSNAADSGSSGGGGSDDCLSCAEAEQVGRRFAMGDAAHGLGMALLPLAVLWWGRRRDERDDER
jgi:hypothetical protein